MDDCQLVDESSRNDHVLSQANEIRLYRAHV